MAIDRDIVTKTAVSIDYTRTGNTLHRRERHGVKDATNSIIVTFDESTDYVGAAGLKYLEDLTGARDDGQVFLDNTIVANDNQEAEIEKNVDFLTAQIDEIEALL